MAALNLYYSKDAINWLDLLFVFRFFFDVVCAFIKCMESFYIWIHCMQKQWNSGLMYYFVVVVRKLCMCIQSPTINIKFNNRHLNGDSQQKSKQVDENNRKKSPTINNCVQQ